jgi:hypothetical protein
MDAYSPVEDLRYSNVSSEFYHYGIEDTLNIASLLVELLATLGYLGRSGATDLHQYIRENVVKPFELLDTELNTIEIEVITVSDEFAEVVPKTEEVAAVVPKIEDSVEMVAELMSQASGVRVHYYMDLEQV